MPGRTRRRKRKAAPSGPPKIGLCINCIAEGLVNKRDAKYPGPRCYSHWTSVDKERREGRRAARIEKTYSITEEEYQRLLAAQGGSCAICKRRPGQKRLAVDHDHACCDGPISCGNCVRGLLCKRCNVYLGHIRDEPEAMDRGSEYLRNPPAHRVLARRG